MISSLSQLSTFVQDAFKAGRVAQPFVPEQTVLGVYTFLPYVRTGLAAAVQDAPPGALRAGVTVQVPVYGDGVPDPVLIAKTLNVRGPGDVLGFDESQVVRRYPQPGTPDAEASFLAHVELDRPDFPWILSPKAPAADRLKPWIALVVLRANRASLSPSGAGLPPRVRTTMSELQSLDDAWAWAHAQITGPAAGPPSVDDRLSAHYGQINLSRLICPRKLDDEQGYLACIVPTFSAGRNAGLGLPDPGTLDAAWMRRGDGADANDEIVLPVYASWRFQTGPHGDFFQLAEKLDGMPAPWNIGRRLLETSRWSGGQPDPRLVQSGSVLVVRGPLFSPAPKPPDAPDDSLGWPPLVTEDLRTELNRPDVLANLPGALPANQLPRVGPDLYGRHQAAESRADPGRDSDWFGQLNITPVNRVVAGLGARVVEKDREDLMQSAWAQFDGLDIANRHIRLAQMGRFVGGSLHSRHLSRLPDGELLQVTRRLHGRVLSGPGGLTLNGTVADSALAPAAVTATFRRATRPLGPLARFAQGARRAELQRLVVDANGQARNFQRQYVDLDGVARISEVAARAIDPLIVSRALGVAPENAVQALINHGQILATTRPLVDLLTPDRIAATAPAPDFDLADFSARLTYDTVTRALPTDPAAAPGETASHLALLRGLAESGGATGQLATATVTRLSQSAHFTVDLQTKRVGSIGTLGPSSVPIGHLAPHVAAAPIGALALAPHPRNVAVTLDPTSTTFVLADHGDRILAVLDVAAANGARTSARGLSDVVGQVVRPDWSSTPTRPALTVERTHLLAQIDPGLTVTRRVTARLGTLPDWLGNWFDDRLVQPIMAAPIFRRPMYQALDAYDRAWMLPGLDKLPVPNLVTLVESNPTFVEAFLVGLSHEMGRKLLWRGFPTDERGTYFRRFFNVQADDLENDIHRFTRTPLGSHLVAALTKPRVVLLIRGELIRRYPDAIVLALRAGGEDDQHRPIFAQGEAKILFHGHLSPDIALVGFDLGVEQIQPEKWWFLIAEHPMAPRFGLHLSREAGVIVSRDTLSWDDLPHPLGFLDATQQRPVPETDAPAAPSTTFGRDAASNAHLLLQDPVRAAFEGAALIAKMKGGG